MFENRPVIGIIVGSAVLIGGTIMASLAGGWIGEGIAKLMFEK